MSVCVTDENTEMISIVSDGSSRVASALQRGPLKEDIATRDS